MIWRMRIQSISREDLIVDRGGKYYKYTYMAKDLLIQFRAESSEMMSFFIELPNFTLY